MSAVYDPAAFSALISKNLAAVVTWVKSHQGESIEACASALSLPYEVVYTVCIEMGLVIVPNASGEIHWHAHKP